MALKDKLGLAMIPSAYSGVADENNAGGTLGKVHSVFPKQTLGENLVTNGTFDGLNGWTSSNSELSIEDDALKITSTGGNRPQANQTVSNLEIGKKYRLSAVGRKGTTDNQIEIEISGISSQVTTNLNNTTDYSLMYYDFIANQTSHIIQAKIDNGSEPINTTAYFSSISLQLISDGDFDFSRGSDATRVNSQGLIESVQSSGVDDTDIPRLDYSDGSCPSLLLEPQRTNQIPNTQDLTGSEVASSIIQYNQGISPDGTNNAIKITRGTNDLVLRINDVVETNKTYAFSVYVKTLSGTQDIRMDIADDSATDFTATNEWQRFELVGEATRTPQSTYNFVDFEMLNSTQGDEILIYAPQVEEGSYPTSYIPTHGSAVTRLADVCDNAGDSTIFNNEEGVLFAEIAALADDGTTRRFSVSDGTNNNRVLIGLSSSNRLQFVVSDNGTTVVNQLITVNNITDLNKIAISYKLNDCSIWINGQEVAVDTVATMPDSLSVINFDQGNGTESFYGKVKSLLYFDKALTDEELEDLTSSRINNVLSDYTTLLSRAGATYESTGLETELNKLF